MEDYRLYIFLILSFVLILLAGFFSMSETALSSLNKYKIQVEANNGKKVSKQILWVLKHFDLSLVTILIGINAVSITVSVVTTTIFAYLFLDSNIDDTWVSLISTIIVTLLMYILAETLPKQLAKKIPNKIAKFVIYPLTFFLILFFPLTIIFYGLSKLFTVISNKNAEPEITEDDFNSTIEENEEQGLIEENETDIIQASFDFADTRVSDVLTKKEKMYSIDLKGITNLELLNKLFEINYSRVPVYYGNKEKIIGVLIVKKFLAAYFKNKKCKISSCIEAPYIVSPSITLDEMVEGFREKKTEIAIVYKDTILLGIITTEDVLEELVGNIEEKPVKEN